MIIFLYLQPPNPVEGAGYHHGSRCDPSWSGSAWLAETLYCGSGWQCRPESCAIRVRNPHSKVEARIHRRHGEHGLQSAPQVLPCHRIHVNWKAAANHLLPRRCERGPVCQGTNISFTTPSLFVLLLIWFFKVLDWELPAIHKACAKLEAGYKPPITFIVVQKRHHTRLFPDNPQDEVNVEFSLFLLVYLCMFYFQCGKGRNVPPGTMVDTQIVHPTENDFFLVSHQAIQVRLSFTVNFEKKLIYNFMIL